MRSLAPTGFDVQEAGGLPEYICQVARAVKRSGKSTSQAIAIAVSRIKRWAAGGDDVDADTRAKAAKALAQWEKLKAKSGKGKTMKASHTGADVLILAKTQSYNLDLVKTAFAKQQREAHRAWRAANPNGDYELSPSRFSVREQWTDFLVVSDGYGEERQLYKVPYTVGVDLDVTFGDPAEVKTEYVAVKESDLVGDDLSDAQLQALVQATPACQFSDVERLLALTHRPARSALHRLLEG